MKRIPFLIALVLLLGASALAQDSTQTAKKVVVGVTNSSSTGTTKYRLAKLTGAPAKAVIAGTSDTDGVIGIVTAGAGTSLIATIQVTGQVLCDFDGATTAGDYVQISSSTAGKCHDSGASTYPASGQVFGRVLSTNVGAGNYSMLLVSTSAASALGFTPENAANKDASGGYAGLTLWKINFRNAANTFTSFFTNSNTAARTYTYQDRNGTIADDTDLALKAPLVSPTLTGTPAAPTAAVDTNTTQVATTGYVIGQGYAKLASPTFTGTPAAPTASAATNTTQIATTAHVFAERSNTRTSTNETYDAEATGNVLTQPFKTWFPAAGCNNATAASFWDLPVSTPAVAACVTGTNTQKGVLQFADTSGGFSAQNGMLLAADFSGTVDARIIWKTSATSGNAKFSLSTICTDVAATATDDPAFNTASTVTTAAPGTANRLQTSFIAGVAITGCAAGNLMHLKLFRDGNDGSDTLSASLDVIGLELTTRRAQ